MRLLLLSIVVNISCIACAPLDLERNVKDQHDAESLIDQGVLMMRAGRLDEARAAFGVSFELNPSAAAIDGLGCVAFRAHRFEEAERYFKMAIEQDPEYSEAYGNLALLVEYGGQKTEAQRLYKEALARKPKNFRARNNLGVLLEGLGERALGRDELLKAAALTDDNLVRDNLKRIGSGAKQE